MNKEPSIKYDKSLFPDQEFTEPDDDSWQISYLDVITILLGFLIILLSVSYFTDNEYFSVSTLFKSDVTEAQFITTPINQIKKGLELSLLDELARDQIEIERDLNDLLIRFSSDDLYLSGSATLQTDALDLLDEVIRAIQRNRYTDFKIDVEGHTDDIPISSKAYPSNWELSTARATNVVKYFTGMGIDPGRLQASGYGDSQPLLPNRNAAGDRIAQNQAKNRRVVLRLYYTTPNRPKEEQQSTDEGIASFGENCRFSVQLGGFQSFTNALNIAKEAIGKTKLNFDVTYNGKLFSVRSEKSNQLRNSLDDYQNIASRYPNQNLGIIHQCYENISELPQTYRYQIQLGAFQSRENAASFTNSLAQDFGFPSNIKTSDGQIHKVVSRPYDRLQSTLAEIQNLKNKGYNGGHFVTFHDFDSTPYQFNFQIQAGVYNDLEQAQQLSQNITNLMGLHTTIRRLEDGRFALITESFQNWEVVTRTLDELSNSSYNLSPLIYLLEYK